MSRADGTRAPILALLRRWVRHVTRFERSLSPGWWDLYGRFLALRQSEYERGAVQLAATLAERYQGVMYQVLRRQGLAEEDLGPRIDQIWQQIASSVRTGLTAREIPAALWHACAGADAASEPLKPKLMLLAFVDELLPEDRDLLLALAYGSGAPPVLGREVLLQRLEAIYPRLHRRLLRQPGAARLTDGYFSRERLRTLEPPYTEYEAWLFPG